MTQNIHHFLSLQGRECVRACVRPQNKMTQTIQSRFFTDLRHEILAHYWQNHHSSVGNCKSCNLNLRDQCLYAEQKFVRSLRYKHS